MAICVSATLLPCISVTNTVTKKFSLRFSTGFRNSSFPQFFGSQVSGRVAFFAGGANFADGEGREGCLAFKNESRGGVGVQANVKWSPKRLEYVAGGNRKGGRRLISSVSAYRRANPSQPDAVPVWVWLVSSLFSAAKAAFLFLCEQPGQLQHIEWPSVNTVMRMAMLTLIVVTCLIVLLATVDSTMSYVLSSMLRRVP